MPELTFGQKLVRSNFNPSANQEVEQLKATAAALIDQIQEIKDRDPRLAELAVTAAETAAMWAVKLATA